MLTMQAAAQITDTLALLLLATAVVSVLTRSIESGVRLLAVQGVLVGAAAAVVALTVGEPHAYLTVALTLAVKVVAVPGLLLRALREVRVTHEVELIIP